MEQTLSLEETLELIKKWRYDKNEEAIVTLVESNSGMIKKLANQYLPSGLLCGLTFEDLESAGLIGVMKAINKFDYEQYDIRTFSTYLYTAISNSIKDELKMNTKHKSILSLDELEYEDGQCITRGELIGSEQGELEEMVISSQRKYAILKALDCLTPLERRVIILRYLENDEVRTCEETAGILGCSKQNVSKHEQVAFQKMKHMRKRMLKDYLY